MPTTERGDHLRLHAAVEEVVVHRDLPLREVVAEVDGVAARHEGSSEHHGAKAHARRMPKYATNVKCHARPPAYHSAAAAAQHDLQDVPEEERDGGEELERRGDVLVGAVVVQHVRRAIEDVSAREQDHRAAEDRAQREAEEDARDDHADGRERRDPQDPPQEREILARDEHDPRQTAEEHERDERRGRGRCRSSSRPR